MNDLNTLLREIHSRADSLAIFAQHRNREAAFAAIEADMLKRGYRRVSA